MMISKNKPTQGKEEKECNYAKCNKQMHKVAGIQTNIGWFCSESCRVAVQKRIFRVLSGMDTELLDKIDNI